MNESIRTREPKSRPAPMPLVVVGLLGGAMVLSGALLALLLPERCPVTRAACNRIEEGMTVAEVEKILGGPAGDYRTLPPSDIEEVHPFIHFTSVSRLKWRGDEGDADVAFDDSGRVAFTLFWKKEPRAVSPVELARWRLKRLQERFLP